MKKVNWLIVGIIGIVLLLFLSSWGNRGWGMMGPGGTVGPSSMMGNWGYSSFGWVGMIFMWLISVGIITLIVLGVVWIMRKSGNSTPPS
jgi:uncharacterized membrane protein